MAKKIADELQNLYYTDPRLNERVTDAIQGRFATSYDLLLARLNDELIDMRISRNTSRAEAASLSADVKALRDALKPFAAIDLTTNQAVDAMDVLRARRVLDGGK